MLKPQQLYVDAVTGTIGAFDSWRQHPETAYFRLSTRVFVSVNPRRMRPAMPAEVRAFRRAERAFCGSHVVTRTPLLHLALCGLAGWLAISVVPEVVL